MCWASAATAADRGTGVEHSVRRECVHIAEGPDEGLCIGARAPAEPSAPKRKRVVHEHPAVLDALRVGDAEAAVRWLDKHRAHAVSALGEVLGSG